MSVRWRKVFYLSGFDPRGAHFYHGLYKAATNQHHKLTGENVTVSKRSADGWQVENKTENTHTDYAFLSWDDIVRDHWIRNPLVLIARVIAMYKDYLLHIDRDIGLVILRMRLSTFLFPFITLVLLPLIVFLLLNVLMHSAMAVLYTVAITPWLLVKLKALWLIRFYVFNHRMSKFAHARLNERLKEFAKTIVESFDEDYDEILLVCHSNGGILAVPLMNEIHKLTSKLPGHFRLLTLGQSIPLVSNLQSATHYNEQLAHMADHQFFWVDINFPPDYACVAANPFGKMEYKAELHMHSPQFYKYYDEQYYRKMRRNKYQLHFAYLQTGHQSSPLDYVAITAGNKTLPERMEALK